MAQANKKLEWRVNAGATPPLAVERAAPMHGASPARALQQLLDERTAQSADVARWSRRRQVAFILAASCALWATLLELATHAVRAIA